MLKLQRKIRSKLTHFAAGRSIQLELHFAFQSLEKMKWDNETKLEARNMETMATKA